MAENPEALLTVRFVPSATGETGAAITTTIQENLFIQGYSFSYEDHLSYGADEVKTFVFDPTACSCFQLVVNPFVFAANAGPVRIKIYAGTTANSDGTILQASNRRATSIITPEAILRLNPTGVTLGTEFAGDLVPATGTGVGNISGGANTGGLPFEIDKALKYALTITNDDGAATFIQMKMTWFEVPAGI